MTDERPPEGRGLAWVNAAKSLTWGNVLILAGLMAVAVPIYVIYRALGDDKLLDRLMSTYEELPTQQNGCIVRHVQERGGPELWGISSGFAFQGADRWYVNVLIDHAPTSQELDSYCGTLKLIADAMLERSDLHTRSVPGDAPDGSERQGRLQPSSAGNCGEPVGGSRQGTVGGWERCER